MCNGKIRISSPNSVGVLVPGGVTSNSLGVIRCFGRRGIPVTYIDLKRGSMVRYSKYITKRLKCRSLRESESEFINLLLDFGSRLNSRMMIIPTGDRDVLVLSRHKKKLEQFYYLPLPAFETVQKLVNKKDFYRFLAERQIPHPKTYFPANVTELQAMGREINYPYIIKPAYSSSFQDEFRRKCFVISSTQALELAVKRLSKKNLEVIVQEIIPGKEIYMFYTYFNRESKPIAICGYDKLRQYPPDFGSGSLCRSAWRAAPIDLALQVLQTLNYHGIAEPEFKRDPRDGQYKLLEINPRTSVQNRLPAGCGGDVEYIAYLDTLGQPVEVLKPPESGVFWVDDFYDFFSCLIQLKEGKLGVSELSSSLTGKKIHSVAAWDDPIPLVAQAINISFQALRRLFSMGRGGIG